MAKCHTWNVKGAILQWVNQYNPEFTWGVTLWLAHWPVSNTDVTSWIDWHFSAKWNSIITTDQFVCLQQSNRCAPAARQHLGSNASVGRRDGNQSWIVFMWPFSGHFPNLLLIAGVFVYTYMDFESGTGDEWCWLTLPSPCALLSVFPCLPPTQAANITWGSRGGGEWDPPSQSFHVIWFSPQDVIYAHFHAYAHH